LATTPAGLQRHASRSAIAATDNNALFLIIPLDLFERANAHAGLDRILLFVRALLEMRPHAPR
jgi:hypothetical protein